jgi:hypothetical protein
MLVVVRKGVVELGIGQTLGVMRSRESEECNLAAGVVEQRRTHSISMARADARGDVAKRMIPAAVFPTALWTT